MLKNLETNDLPNSYEDFMKDPDIKLNDRQYAIRYDKNIIRRFFALLFEPDQIPVMKNFDVEIENLQSKLDDTDTYVLYHMLQYAMNGAARDIVKDNFIIWTMSDEKVQD